MPTFLLKVRKTLADEIVSVDAPTKEDAIFQQVQTAGEGESIEVMDSELVPEGPTGGETGATGSTGATGMTE